MSQSPAESLRSWSTVEPGAKRPKPVLREAPWTAPCQRLFSYKARQKGLWPAVVKEGIAIETFATRADRPLYRYMSKRVAKTRFTPKIEGGLEVCLELRSGWKQHTWHGRPTGFDAVLSTQVEIHQARMIWIKNKSHYWCTPTLFEVITEDLWVFLRLKVLPIFETSLRVWKNLK